MGDKHRGRCYHWTGETCNERDITNRRSQLPAPNSPIPHENIAKEIIYVPMDWHKWVAPKKKKEAFARLPGRTMKLIWFEGYPRHSVLFHRAFPRELK